MNSAIQAMFPPAAGVVGYDAHPSFDAGLSEPVTSFAPTSVDPVVTPSVPDQSALSNPSVPPIGASVIATVTVTSGDVAEQSRVLFRESECLEIVAPGVFGARSGMEMVTFALTYVPCILKTMDVVDQVNPSWNGDPSSPPAPSATTHMVFGSHG